MVGLSMKMFNENGKYKEENPMGERVSELVMNNFDEEGKAKEK